MTEIRAAIAAHGTSVTDDSWDAGANLKRMGDDPSEAALRKMHAWVDPDGDPAAKSSYKFPHHLVGNGGSVGAACLKACSSGIGVLNGGRGGAAIPDSDRSGVYNHLARHMRDGGEEPPELNSMRNLERNLVRRAWPTQVQVRKNASGTEAIIEGHAAVFDSLSEDLGGFFEIVRNGAFAKTIKENDVKALWNHNPDVVLGRNRNDTLTMNEDRRGLMYEAKADLTNPAVVPVVRYIERGDVDQCSFSFSPIRERWGNGGDAGMESNILLCEQLEVRLWDVSPVTFPAYPQTDVSVRGILDLYLDRATNDQLHMRDLIAAMQRQEHGVPFTERDQQVLALTRQAIDRMTTRHAVPPSTPGARDTQQRGTDLALLRRQLAVAGEWKPDVIPAK